VAKLKKKLTIKLVFKNQKLTDYTEESDTVFFLVQGSVWLDIDDHVLDDFQAPVMLGEMGLLQPGVKNIATVRSRGYGVVWSIETAVLQRLLEQFPEDLEVFRERAQASLEHIRDILMDKFHGSREASPAARADDAELFRGVLHQFFKDSDPRFCDFLVRGMKQTIFFAEQVLLKEGDDGDFAIIIQRGSAFVEVSGVRVREVKEGGLIGEAVLVGNAVQRTATVRAQGCVHACTLARSVVLEAFGEFPGEKKRVQEMLKLSEQANKLLTGQGGREVSQSSKAQQDSGEPVLNPLRRTSIAERALELRAEAGSEWPLRPEAEQRRAGRGALAAAQNQQVDQHR